MPVDRRTLMHPIRGQKYAVSEWGNPSNPLLFYLHGFADTGSTFEPVARSLADNWHIVAPDWRGFGRTEVAAAAFWFPDYLADLHALLEVYAPDASVRLIGHSMGANVAGLYAGSMPDRVHAFANLEGFGLADSDPAEAPDRYRRWLLAGAQESGNPDYPDFASLAKRIRRRNPRISTEMAAFVAREWGRETEAGRIELRAHPAHRLPNAVLYRREEAKACWAAVSAKVLMVSGADSTFGGMERPCFRHSESVEISDAGHMLHLEQPQALADALEGFFRQTL